MRKRDVLAREAVLGHRDLVGRRRYNQGLMRIRDHGFVVGGAWYNPLSWKKDFKKAKRALENYVDLAVVKGDIARSMDEGDGTIPMETARRFDEIVGNIRRNEGLFQEFKEKRREVEQFALEAGPELMSDPKLMGGGEDFYQWLTKWVKRGLRISFRLLCLAVILLITMMTVSYLMRDPDSDINTGWQSAKDYLLAPVKWFYSLIGWDYPQHTSLKEQCAGMGLGTSYCHTSFLSGVLQSLASTLPSIRKFMITISDKVLPFTTASDMGSYWSSLLSNTAVGGVGCLASIGGAAASYGVTLSTTSLFCGSAISGVFASQFGSWGKQAEKNIVSAARLLSMWGVVAKVWGYKDILDMGSDVFGEGSVRGMQDVAKVYNTYQIRTATAHRSVSQGLKGVSQAAGLVGAQSAGLSPTMVSGIKTAHGIGSALEGMHDEWNEWNAPELREVHKVGSKSYAPALSYATDKFTEYALNQNNKQQQQHQQHVEKKSTVDSPPPAAAAEAVQPAPASRQSASHTNLTPTPSEPMPNYLQTAMAGIRPQCPHNGVDVTSGCIMDPRGVCLDPYNSSVGQDGLCYNNSNVPPVFANRWV